MVSFCTKSVSRQANLNYENYLISFKIVSANTSKMGLVLLIKTTVKFTSLILKLYCQRDWRRCFPENFVKILRTRFLQKTSGRLLLSCLLPNSFRLWPNRLNNVKTSKFRSGDALDCDLNSLLDRHPNLVCVRCFCFSKVVYTRPVRRPGCLLNVSLRSIYVLCLQGTRIGMYLKIICVKLSFRHVPS